MTPPIISPILQRVMRPPIARAHIFIDRLGVSVVYMNKMDSLLKQTVAFYRSTKDMTPCHILD